MAITDVARTTGGSTTAITAESLKGYTTVQLQSLMESAIKNNNLGLQKIVQAEISSRKQTSSTTKEVLSNVSEDLPLSESTNKSKDWIKYGAIGVGVVLVLFISYKIYKKVKK